MQREKLAALGAKYTTPLYVFDAGKLAERLRTIKEIVGEQIHLCYSMKANPFLIRELPACVEHIEVCSPGELSICKNQGIAPESIIYSGVHKASVDIGEAVAYGVGIATAESIRHVELLNQAVCEKKQAGAPRKVLLRLNAGSQFGMSKEDLFMVLANREQYPGLDFVGIHYFAGTQRRKIKGQIRELERLCEVYREIRDRFGIVFEKLEYGPGLPVPYFEGEDFADTLAPMRELAPQLLRTKETLDEICGHEVEVTIEMGRFYTAECGYFLTTVADAKSNEDVNYLILDGGIHQVNYLGQMMGMKVPKITHWRPDAEVGFVQVPRPEEGADRKEWCLCGSLCTTSDIIVRQIPLTEPAIGDMLIFENTGAYSAMEGMLLFLSRAMPAVVIVREDGTEILARGHVETSPLNQVQ